MKRLPLLLLLLALPASAGWYAGTVGTGAYYPPVLGIDAGYPVTGASALDYQGNPSSTVITGIGDGSTGRLYVLALAMSVYTGTAHPPVITGGTWTRVKGINYLNTDGQDYGGVTFWYCTDALNNQTVTVSRDDGATTDYTTYRWVIWRFSNASSTVGATAALGGTTNGATSVSLTPTKTGSYVLGASLAINNTLTGFPAANNTQVAGADMSGLASLNTIFVRYTGAVTSGTPITVGASVTTDWRATAAIEVKSP